MAEYDKSLEYVSQTQTLVGQKKRVLFSQNMKNRSMPHDNISEDQALTLFWWWSIDSANRCKGTWRDTLTPEEQELVDFWDNASDFSRNQERASIRPLKTEPGLALKFIQELLKGENRELTSVEKENLENYLKAAHDKHKKEME